MSLDAMLAAGFAAHMANAKEGGDKYDKAMGVLDRVSDGNNTVEALVGLAEVFMDEERGKVPRARAPLCDAVTVCVEAVAAIVSATTCGQVHTSFAPVAEKVLGVSGLRPLGDAMIMLYNRAIGKLHLGKDGEFKWAAMARMLKRSWMAWLDSQKDVAAAM